jgi:hypothetical protein
MVEDLVSLVLPLPDHRRPLSASLHQGRLLRLQQFAHQPNRWGIMSRTAPERKRCKMSGAVSRLAEEPRTIRDMAARGEIPGAAKMRGVWSFDIALLDAFVSDKERQTWQSASHARPLRDVSGGTVSSMGAYRPQAATSNGHYGQTIQRLRQAAARRNEPA